MVNSCNGKKKAASRAARKDLQNKSHGSLFCKLYRAKGRHSLGRSHVTPTLVMIAISCIFAVVAQASSGRRPDKASRLDETHGLVRAPANDNRGRAKAWESVQVPEEL
jgi:hypothetical protein